MVPEGQNVLPEADWKDATLRQYIRVSLPGSRLRLRISNVFGTAPLAIEAATLARPVALARPDIDPATLRTLTFGGRAGVTIPAGAEYYSDPVTLEHPAGADLAISLHYKDAPARQTGHPGSRTTSFTAKGNRVADAAWPDAAKFVRWYQIADLEVEAPRSVGVVSAIGDSITDGAGTTTDGNDRWTDALAARFAREGHRMGIVNTGIGGGRLLRDGLGPNLVARFDRDVLGRSGVTHAIVLIGVNDLGSQHRNNEDTPAARAKLVEDMQSAFRQVVGRAHAKGVCVTGGTIVPYGTSGYYKPNELNEADRQQLNAWIRTSGVFDSVADFDAAIRDPQQPNRMRTEHDSGDGLHPSPAGYRAMADAVPLAALQGCTSPPPSSYRNPVLTGFHADPSLCRVGSDYYLATSSFEYFPGVPIYHSKDLVHWRQIGHALTRESQLPLAGQKASKGIFAPTLRCQGGLFYMVTTNVDGGGNFYVTTRDPAGEWSEPVWLREKDGWMDPSLFFDDDGTVYYTRHGGGRNGGVYQARIDLKAGKLLEDAKLIWPGTGGIWPEGPHLYKIDGTYYLLISEGGTSYGHMLTVARSKSPWGPFEANPANPILTHRARPELPLQAIGHADLVQAENGSWWIVLLGVRSLERNHHIGRETLLAPVTWDAQGWPVVNGGRPLALQMAAERLPPSAPWPREAVRDEFNGPRLGLQWAHLRGPATGLWSLTERAGTLRLKGSQQTLDDAATPAFVARRQEHLRMRAATQLEFSPTAEPQMAGLVLRQNEDNYYALRVAGAGARRIELVTRVKGVTAVRESQPLGAGAVTLQVEAFPERYDFSIRAADGTTRAIGSAPTQPLSSEKAGGFTGVFVGMYASAASGGPMPPADFAWFDYEPLEN
ncbi:hypothetical protein BWI17_02655 [Betaproteobacteria bacterium GR16-43]|nr:hypothetical protein BWI17_02655 [Betaproteobacteria bacterium GR16-43]